MNKGNISKFVEKSKKIHGHKYDYKFVNYIDAHTKVKIICPIHGEFLQNPNNHLNGKGCKKCGNIKIGLSQKITTDEFIYKSNEIHKNKYDYSKTNYINCKSKIIIICPIHGNFLQTPEIHLKKCGCPICNKSSKITTNEFINRANKIHKNKYDYSKSNYITANIKIEIICSKHGSFYQTPKNHLEKRGCQKCGLERSSIIFNSIGETKFLNYLKISKVNRGKCINNYIVDGYDKKTNTIYEFLGDYWHGNPEKFNKFNFNKTAKKTFNELYDYTFCRFKILKDNGYNIKYIWENDWNKFKKGIDKNPNIKSY